MKILMDKPAPSIPSQSNPSASTSQPDLFEMLSACLFTDVMKITGAEEKPTSEQTIEKTDNTSDASPANAVVTLDSIQKMIDEMLQQATTYRPQQNLSAANTQTNPASTVLQASPRQPIKPTMNSSTNPLPTNQLAPSEASNDKDTSIDSLATRGAQLDATEINQLANDHQDEKLTAIEKKLTRPMNRNEIPATNNVLAATMPAGPSATRTEPKDLTSKSIQIDSQTKTLKKTLDNWTQSVNKPEQAQQVMPATNQPANFSQEFSKKLASTPLPTKPDSTALTMQLDHLEPSSSEPGVFHVKIKVNPPELGPIHANIKMNHNTVEIQIMTNNAHAEQVVKAHVSALVTQFSESSLQLNTVVVQQQATTSGGQDQQDSPPTPKYNDEQIQQPLVNNTQADDKKQTRSNKLVDAYI
jgi:flagellar hook-length control protein FliK